MKILSGKLKGRAILFDRALDLRPTSDKVRKAIFDMLKEAVEGASVLDLFSGTGALGFEALSQGAERVVFVESNRPRCRKIDEGIAKLGLSEKAFTVPIEVGQALGQFSKAQNVYDIIFLDPPYRTGLALSTLALIADSKIFHEKTLIIAEIASRESLPDVIGVFRAIRKKTYGDTQLNIYLPRQTGDADPDVSAEEGAS